MQQGLMMKVSVNRDICSGHAMCNRYCPEVYGADEGGFCVIAVADVPEGLQEKARLGAGACPEGAITIVED